MIFGWDISTSIIGSSIFTREGEYVDSHFLDLRKIEGGQIYKAHELEMYVNDYVRSYKCDTTHYIEDKLGSFAGGKTMQQTLMKLAAFNATVSFIIWRQFNESGYTTDVEHIHPSTVKSLVKPYGLVIPKGGDKKKLTLDFVSKREKTFPVKLNKNDNPQPYCFDMADSYIVALAGYRKNWCSEKES